MIKKLAIVAVAAAALTGCVVHSPAPLDTAKPPISPAMSCDAAQTFVNTALNADTSTLSGAEARRRVLGASSVILANSSCFSAEMVQSALESFQHENLDPQKYGYSASQ